MVFSRRSFRPTRTRRALHLPDALRGPLGGRHQVRRGLRAAAADVNVFNTQVPAALGGRIARRKPYVAVTDVTPIQYDRMAEGYGHRPDSGGPLSRYKHHVNREIYGRALACVAWSTWAASSMEADYGVSPERITVIPPGVDLDPWRPR